MDQVNSTPTINDAAALGELLDNMMHASQVSGVSHNQQTSTNGQDFQPFALDTSFQTLNSPHPSGMNDGVFTPSPISNQAFTGNNRFCYNVNGEDVTEAEDHISDGSGSPTTGHKRLFFLCPYYMYDPIQYHSCRDHHHDQFSRVKQHVFRSHLNWCTNCHQDFLTKSSLSNHNSQDCIKSHEKPPGYCDDTVYREKLSQRMSGSTDLDRYNEMVKILFHCTLPADTDISFPYPVIIEEFTEGARDRLTRASLSSILTPIMNSMGQQCLDSITLERIRVQVLEAIGLQRGQQEIRRQIVESKKRPRMYTARDNSPHIRTPSRHTSPFPQRNVSMQGQKRPLPSQQPVARARSQQFRNSLNVGSRVTKSAAGSPYAPNSLQVEHALTAGLHSPIAMPANTMLLSPYSMPMNQPYENPEFSDPPLFPPQPPASRRMYPTLQIPNPSHISGIRTSPTMPSTPRSPFEVALQPQLGLSGGYGQPASSPIPARNLTVDSPVFVVTSPFPPSPSGMNPGDPHMGGF